MITQKRKRLEIESLGVDSFPAESSHTATIRQEMMVGVLTRTNCPLTGVDSTCPCCSDPFTCPC